MSYRSRIREEKRLVGLTGLTLKANWLEHISQSLKFGQFQAERNKRGRYCEGMLHQSVDLHPVVIVELLTRRKCPALGDNQIP